MGLCRGGHLPAKQLILKFLLQNHSVIYIWKHLRLFFPPALLLYSCSVLNSILGQKLSALQLLRPTTSPPYTFSALLLLQPTTLHPFTPLLDSVFEHHNLIFRSTASPPFNLSTLKLLHSTSYPPFFYFALQLLRTTTITYFALQLLRPFTPLLMYTSGIQLLRPTTTPPYNIPILQLLYSTLLYSDLTTSPCCSLSSTQFRLPWFIGSKPIFVILISFYR